MYSEELSFPDLGHPNESLQAAHRPRICPLHSPPIAATSDMGSDHHPQRGVPRRMVPGRTVPASIPRLPSPELRTHSCHAACSQCMVSDRYSRPLERLRPRNAGGQRHLSIHCTGAVLLCCTAFSGCSSLLLLCTRLPRAIHIW